MRSGHLLAEESPENLLTLHGLNTLEEVFLKLSSKEHALKHGALTASGRAIRSAQQEEQGHDNAAFVCTTDNPDATSMTLPNNRVVLSDVSDLYQFFQIRVKIFGDRLAIKIMSSFDTST